MSTRYVVMGSPTDSAPPASSASSVDTKSVLSTQETNGVDPLVAPSPPSNSPNAKPVPGAEQLQRQDDQLTLTQRATAATVGALITSLVVTPMDVVKHRWQAQRQLPTLSSSAPSTDLQAAEQRVKQSSYKIKLTSVSAAYEEMFARSNFYRLHTGVYDIWCPKCNVNPQLNPELRFRGPLHALLTIPRVEGIAALWRGLSPALIMAVPSTIAYFTAYDTWRHKLEKIGLPSSLATLVAGVTARSMTTTLVAPLELIRTRAQVSSSTRRWIDLVREELISNPTPQPSLAASSAESAALRGAAADSAQEYSLRHLLRLWRGLEPTLYRDVVFSAIYWLGLESIRARLLDKLVVSKSNAAPSAEDGSPGINPRAVWLSSFIGGALSGALATTITQPFDVIKTRRQIAYFAPLPSLSTLSDSISAFAPSSRSSVPSQFIRILREEGPSALFTGLLPRLTKIMPSCAIMISTYEVAKQFFWKAPPKSG